MSEGRVGDEPDPELAQQWQDHRFDVAGPERVFDLDRGDRVRGMRTANRFGARLGQTEVADLARSPQFGHRVNGLLDRD